MARLLHCFKLFVLNCFHVDERLTQVAVHFVPMELNGFSLCSNTVAGSVAKRMNVMCSIAG